MFGLQGHQISSTENFTMRCLGCKNPVKNPLRQSANIVQYYYSLKVTTSGCYALSKAHNHTAKRKQTIVKT
jgi:hypothetical protein